MKNKLRLILFLVTLSLFVFLRVFNITQNLHLFGDFGRDLSVLQSWSNNLLKPPLLGPQTSVISFNQSAIYYYYLFPFFLIMSHSVYSTLVASIALYLSVFIFLWWFYRMQPNWQWRLLALFLLISIHPQFVLQQRYVWNPSLITPFLLLSMWSWIEFQKLKTDRWIWGMVFPLAIAASLNFSILPTVLVFLVLLSWQECKSLQNLFKIFLFGGITGLLVNFPTLIFELRHNLLLTKTLSSIEVLQQETLLINKFRMFATNIFLPTLFDDSSIVILGVITLILSIVYFSKKYYRTTSIQAKIYRFSFQMFLGSSLLLLFSPLKMHEHYMFGVLTFLLISIATLPKKLILTIIFTTMIIYLQPRYFDLYQKTAPHTIEEKTNCIQTFCEERLNQRSAENPIFVNTHSVSHNHQSLEYIFLLNEFGCSAIDTQEFNATPVDEMLVVADNAEFENGKTAYYELSQFGEAEEVKSYQCGNNLNLYLMKKSFKN